VTHTVGVTEFLITQKSGWRVMRGTLCRGNLILLRKRHEIATLPSVARDDMETIIIAFVNKPGSKLLFTHMRKK
jgi:hypothetical protein